MSNFVMNRIVIASNNPGKLRELSALLKPLGIEAAPQSDFAVTEAEEPHFTFIENALAKARHAANISGLPALAASTSTLSPTAAARQTTSSAFFNWTLLCSARARQWPSNLARNPRSCIVRRSGPGQHSIEGRARDGSALALRRRRSCAAALGTAHGV